MAIDMTKFASGVAGAANANMGGISSLINPSGYSTQAGSLMNDAAGLAGLIPPPYGMIAGTALKVGSNIVNATIGKKQAEEAAEAAEKKQHDDFVLGTQQNAQKAMAMNTFGADNYNQDVAGNALANFAAEGGMLRLNGGDFKNGLTVVGAGGSHESNPHEGVPMGVDPNGTPNLVEEGEVIWEDYVFSKRLKVPKKFTELYKLTEGISFADAALKFGKETDENPTDRIAKDTLTANLTKLMEAQEGVRERRQRAKAMKEFNALTPEEQQGIVDMTAQQSQANAQPQMPPIGEIPMTPEESMPEIPADANVENMAAEGGKLNKFALGDQMYNMDDKQLAALYGENGPSAFAQHLIGMSGNNPYSWGLNNMVNYYNPWSAADPAYFNKEGNTTGKYSMDTLSNILKAQGYDENMSYDDYVKNIAKPFWDNVKSSEANKQAWYDNYSKHVSFKDGTNRFIDDDGKLLTGEAFNKVFDDVTYNQGKRGILGAAQFAWNPQKKYYQEDGNGGYSEITDYDPSRYNISESLYNQGSPQEAYLVSNKKRLNAISPIENPFGLGATTEDNGLMGARPNMNPDKKTGNTDDGSSKNRGIDASILRYAPALGGIIGLATSAFNKPDYSRAEEIKDAAAYEPALISPAVIGNYEYYNPLDEWAIQNQANANAAATRTAIQQQAGTRGSAIAGLIGADYVNQNAVGENHIKAAQYNDALKDRVEQFNRGTNQFNAQSIMTAQQANQSAINAALQHRYQGIVAGNTLMDNIDARKGTKISADVSNVLGSLGEMGEEAMNRKWLGNLENSGVLATDWYGNKKYAMKACGGRMLTKVSKRKK